MISDGERLLRSLSMVFSRRFHCLIVLLALPLLLGAKVRTVDGPVLYKDGIVQVVSLNKLSTAECKEAANMVKAAWNFDLNVMRWSDSPGLHRPLTLQVNNTDRMKKENPGMRAITKDWTKNVGTVMSLSPKEASVILTDDSYSNNEKDAGKTFKMESMGVYFVEYMRTQCPGKGIPDMVPKMGRVFELVGRCKTYEQAFKQVYGVSVDRVVSEIVGLFKRTQANPAERFNGTRFEVASQVVAGKSRK